MLVLSLRYAPRYIAGSAHLHPDHEYSPDHECSCLLSPFIKLVGAWVGVTEYPIAVAESQGAMIGTDFLLVSGFSQTYNNVTAANYALDTTYRIATWKRMDDFPIAAGTTHSSFVVIGKKLFMCGGYVGGVPGPHTDKCFIYDHAVAPGAGNQWSTFASLPGGGRAGGAMLYDTSRQALFYTAGAQRPFTDSRHADDFSDTWMYSFNNPGLGWTVMVTAQIPFLGNHMSYVTAKDPFGRERHFCLGGQKGENEALGNNKDNYEWDAENEAWFKRQSMPFSRGHASSSTRAIGCGFVIAGGTTNEFNQTADVSYYDIPTDTWTSIGLLPLPINTPVCDFSNGYLHCQSGYANAKFAYRRPIVV